jgi:hypothetical protein
MRRQAVAVIVMAVLFGCATGGGGRSTASKSNATATMDPPAQAMSDTQLAAHAGNAEFPRQASSDGRRVAAIVAADRKTIKLYNFESTPINAVNVWVNQAYVQPLRALPANSKSPIRTDKLFNKGGQRFSERNEEVNAVQLETPQGLFTAMGPQTE